MQPKEEAMAEIPRPSEDLDGEPLEKEPDAQGRPLRRSLDGDLKRVESVSAGSVNPAPGSLDMQRILEEQKRNPANSVTLCTACAVCF